MHCVGTSYQTLIFLLKSGIFLPDLELFLFWSHCVPAGGSMFLKYVLCILRNNRVHAAKISTSIKKQPILLNITPDE